MKLCDVTETAPNCLSTSVLVASQGTWTLNTSTGLVNFIPLALFYGDATPITYTGSDVVGATFSSTISASITPPTLPSAVADSASGVVTSSINCRFLFHFLALFLLEIAAALAFASDFEEAPHACSDRSKRVGEPSGLRSGPGIPPIRARKDALRGLSPDLTGALRVPPL
jgi:hypothetical protein